MHLFEPESFQCAEVVRIAELAPQLFENVPVKLAGIDPICFGQIGGQIGLDAVIIKERVVDIEKKDEVVHRGHGLSACRLRIVPWAVRPDQLIGFLWSPASLFIDDRRSNLVQNRIHNAPLGVDNVLPAEKISDAMHRVAQQTLIGRHESRLLLGQDQLDVLAFHALARMFDPQTQCDADIWADPHPHMTRGRGNDLREGFPRWSFEIHHDLR